MNDGVGVGVVYQWRGLAAGSVMGGVSLPGTGVSDVSRADNLDWAGGVIMISGQWQ